MNQIMESIKLLQVWAINLLQNETSVQKIVAGNLLTTEVLQPTNGSPGLLEPGPTALWSRQGNDKAKLLKIAARSAAEKQHISPVAR